MKDVISVDTILQEHREWMRGIRTDHLIGTSHRETKEALHSLLISKLPEKKQMKYVKENSPVTETDEKRCRFYRYGGYDFAIDDMHRVIDEMFGVQND
jgi:hypothetical protein